MDNPISALWTNTFAMRKKLVIYLWALACLLMVHMSVAVSLAPMFDHAPQLTATHNPWLDGWGSMISIVFSLACTYITLMAFNPEKDKNEDWGFRYGFLYPVFMVLITILVPALYILTTWEFNGHMFTAAITIGVALGSFGEVCRETNTKLNNHTQRSPTNPTTATVVF